MRVWCYADVNEEAESVYLKELLPGDTNGQSGDGICDQKLEDKRWTASTCKEDQIIGSGSGSVTDNRTHS